MIDFSTLASMEEAKKQKSWANAVGVVIFARGVCPSWIHPIFATGFLFDQNLES
jgi:hypothetical protein